MIFGILLLHSHRFINSFLKPSCGLWGEQLAAQANGRAGMVLFAAMNILYRVVTFYVLCSLSVVSGSFFILVIHKAMVHLDVFCLARATMDHLKTLNPQEFIGIMSVESNPFPKPKFQKRFFLLNNPSF